MSLTVSPIWNADGTLVGAASVKRDVTAQRSLEERLRSGPEAGSARPARRRRRVPRLQQHPDDHRRLYRVPRPRHSARASGAHRSARQVEEPRTRRTAHPAASRLCPASDRARRGDGSGGRRQRDGGAAAPRPAVTISGSRCGPREDRSGSGPIQGQISQVLIDLAVQRAWRDRQKAARSAVAVFNNAAADRAVLTVRDVPARGWTGHQGAPVRPVSPPRPRPRHGAGLTTVASIVHSAGGRVEVESAPGQGAVFRINLPRALPADGSEQPQDPVDLRGHEAVLVVDDETVPPHSPRARCSITGIPSSRPPDQAPPWSPLRSAPARWTSW